MADTAHKIAMEIQWRAQEALGRALATPTRVLGFLRRASQEKWDSWAQGAGVTSPDADTRAEVIEMFERMERLEREESEEGKAVCGSEPRA